MPIKHKILKDLYMGHSMDDLRKMGDNTKSSTSTAITSLLIKTAIKLYDEAKRSDETGDEERSYVLFYRFFESVKTYRKSNEYKKEEKFFNEMIGLSKLNDTVESMERLTTSLVKRYSDLMESRELRAKEIRESMAKTNDTNNQLNSDSIKSKANDLNDNSYPLMDCFTLCESLENSSELTKILIIDTRSADEFKDSHIDRIKTTADLTVANIPSDQLVPGLTASILGQSLPLGTTKDAFDRRRQMKTVVIIDKHSRELIPKTPAYHLMEALWKWDQSSLKLKAKSFLLKGGYEEWVLTYPMFTSNPNYFSKSNNSSLTIKPNKSLNFNYEFNDSESEDKKPDNHLVNGITNGDITQESELVVEQTRTLNDIFHPRPTNEAVPGTALPLIPDRSTKPLLQINDKNLEKKLETNNEMFEKLKYKRKAEISEEMLTYLRDGYNEEIQNITKELESKDEENKHLRTTIRKLIPEKPKHLTSNETDDTNDKYPEIAINGDINSFDKRNGFDVKVSEAGDDCKENGLINGNLTDNNSHNRTPHISTSASKPIIKTPNSLSVNSSLSRSLSSPNIVELMAKENLRDKFDRNEFKERSVTNPALPQIDRTLKPLINREKYNFQESTIIDNKLRDFCPVHCSGNAITGLKNLGNTCFMSAVIQCLLNTKDFSSYFVNGNLHVNRNSKFGSNGELVIELSALFRAMAYPSTYKSISPKDFKQSVSKHIKGFIGYAQEDSHEFLVKLLEKLHEDLNESTARDVIDTSVSDDLSLSAGAHKFWKNHLNRNKSIITELFEGLIVNTLMCLTCHKTSNTFEVFSCLSLPLRGATNRTTLNECLNQYFKTERMSGEAAWECPTCKQKREADKKVQVWKWPKVLIVHLKRFSYEGVWRQKLQTTVDFPIENLCVHSVQSESRYNLYGVVNHYGTLEGGHYTAYSHRSQAYRWHKFDDQEVTQMHVKDVPTQAAYLLFYTNCL